MATAPSRRTARVLLTLLLTALAVTVGAGTAQAADGYKYWNYFHVQGAKYVFAQTGPADFTPKDGSVEAWRYGLSSAADGLQPRTAASTYTADKICAGKSAATGEKMVGVLIDYGTTADAAGGQTPPKPRAACAVVPTAANGQQVLDAVSDLRLDKGVACGIDGYPASTCSVTVKNPPAAAKEQPVSFAMPAAKSESSGSSQSASDSENGGVPWTLVGVVVAVVVIGGGALVLSRRNKRA